MEKTQETTTEEHIKKGFDIEQEKQQQFLKMRTPLNTIEVKSKNERRFK